MKGLHSENYSKKCYSSWGYSRRFLCKSYNSRVNYIRSNSVRVSLKRVTLKFFFPKPGLFREPARAGAHQRRDPRTSKSPEASRGPGIRGGSRLAASESEARVQDHLAEGGALPAAIQWVFFYKFQVKPDVYGAPCLSLSRQPWEVLV